MLCRTLHETTHIHEIQNITCMSPHSCTFAHYMPSRTFITLPLAKGLIKLSGSMPGPTLYATLYIHEKLYITCDGVHSCIDPHCMRLYTFMHPRTLHETRPFMLFGHYMEVIAPFPSFGLGNTLHQSAPYAVGLTPPPSGCHLVTAHGAGTGPAPSPALYLRKRVKTLARLRFIKLLPNEPQYRSNVTSALMPLERTSSALLNRLSTTR